MRIERTDYGRAILACVAAYPGVTVRFETSSKHNQAILSFAAQTRKVTFPNTPSHSKGPLNCCQNVRAALRIMGAQREKRSA